jgi:hypothetical protein
LPFRYETQLLGKADAVARRIDRLVSRVAVEPDGALRRPKGMHRKTFQRIVTDARRTIGFWKSIDPTYRYLTATTEDLEARTRAHYAKALLQGQA